MKLYLGNYQNVELDLDDNDIINIFPSAKARGGYWNVQGKNAFRVETYDGIKSEMKSIFIQIILHL
ncbi:MAG: hypothetical protein EBS55_11695 [Flavobacteriaceae bacterium]|nr:hypothetical protein [Flavobacteriaceae bacterium]